MTCSTAVIFLLFVHVLAADDDFNLHDKVSAEENKYISAINNLDEAASIDIRERSRRQANSGFDEEYYVTQCGYDSLQRPDGPSIQVLGKEMESEGATLKAAKLVHLLVRFMPRPLFMKIAKINTVGLFPRSVLPDSVFEEFDKRPSVCRGRCGIQFQGNEMVDCSQWCTSADYPYQRNAYPINYLWTYGNFSRLFVVDTNVICGNSNPSKSQNLLVQEFGFMMMARIFDNQTLADVDDAYTSQVANSTWLEMKNKYEYFMMGTLAWFDAAHFSSQLKGMACKDKYGNNGKPLCSDSYEQRQYIKKKDLKLYKILNYVYNSNREYVNADTAVCTW